MQGTSNIYYSYIPGYKDINFFVWLHLSYNLSYALQPIFNAFVVY